MKGFLTRVIFACLVCISAFWSTGLIYLFIDDDFSIEFAIFWFVIFALLIVADVRCWRNIAKKRAEAARQKAERIMEAQRKKEEAEAEIARKNALWEEDHRPVKAVLISTTDKTTTSKGGVGTAGRAIVGGVLLGPIGALAGAASGKSETTVVDQDATFFVKYANGSDGTETVAVGSLRFKELAALLVE